MTLATPPERSGAGSAVQNTVRQVGAVFGVAILSSVVGTVYSNNITPLLEGKGLPPEALQRGHRLDRRHQRGRRSAGRRRHVPAAAIEQLRQAANDSFMPALHTAAFVSAGLLVIAIAVILLRLPAKAEAVAWSGSGPGIRADRAPAAPRAAMHTADELRRRPADIPRSASRRCRRAVAAMPHRTDDDDRASGRRRRPHFGRAACGRRRYWTRRSLGNPDRPVVDERDHGSRGPRQPGRPRELARRPGDHRRHAGTVRGRGIPRAVDGGGRRAGPRSARRPSTDDGRASGNSSRRPGHA